MKSETNENKIAQLQLLDQNLQQILMQKQQYQSQIIEIDNSLEELEKSKGNVYKIVGAIMVNGDKEELKKELLSKKELVELRIKSFEKQENQIKEKIDALQSEVMLEMKKKVE